MSLFTYLHNVSVLCPEHYDTVLTQIIDYWYQEDIDLVREIDFNYKNMINPKR